MNWAHLGSNLTWAVLTSCCALIMRSEMRFCSAYDYLWTFFRANRFQKAWTWMSSATGQSWAAGLLTSRVPMLFSCLTGKHLWLKSHLVYSYQKSCVLLLNRHGSYWFLLCAHKNTCWRVSGTVWNGSRKSLMRQRRKQIFREKKYLNDERRW